MLDISFVVTIYNKNINDVKRCLRSIKKMDSLTHEIIVVDDGSKKNMSEQYVSLAYKYNARYYYQQNQGVSEARNQGLLHAKGNYIFFVDCDDVVINEKINKEDLLDAPDVVIYNVLKEESGDHSKVEKTLSIDSKGNGNWLAAKDLVDETIKDGLMNWAYGKLYSVNFLKDHSLFFDSNLKTGEDLDFVVRVVEKSNKIKYISKIVYKYKFSITTGRMRIRNAPENAINDTYFVYQLRSKLLSNYNLNRQLVSVNEEQTLKSYFEIYSLCINENLLTDRLYKAINNKVKLVKREGKVSLTTSIKTNIIINNYKLLAYLYNKLKMIYKNIGN